MSTEWDYAHTDFGARTAFRGPAGLADSPDDWLAALQAAPHGRLLHDNTMIGTLTSGRPIHLMHTTLALDAIRATGELYGAAGCLVGALYCAPLTPVTGGLRPHNLGAYLLETKTDTKTLVFEIRPEQPAPAKGLNYLRLGGIHLRTYRTYRSFLIEAEDARLRNAAVQRVRAAAGILDLLLAEACGTRTTSETVFFNQLAAAVPQFPFLGYLYFEALSEYLLLHSTSPLTQACAELGEMNNRLYKQLAFAAVATMGRLFDLARFNPDHAQLLDLIRQIEPGLDPGATAHTRRRLAHLFACAALGPDRDAAAITFQDAATDFDALAGAAPQLAGQLVFREMRTLPRYPALFAVFEQAKATEVYGYWNREQIAAPFNGVLPKGEIGINLAFPHATCTAWVAETCERGLLHPTEQLDLILVPRLMDLRGTALGRAAFPTPAAPAHTPALAGTPA
ncbi:hypothetical protein FE633_11090 [Streptomyces montanus]|uniref:Uncharacterized protein n=1 Tax=Streptomyces montanus TaxID=2580423 RepID=A0A5R9FQ84_9ACTN|nr:hypothetical protein [Streptomyces montanus]TLS46087.1 hypothetical protein FE633_11090 [Streptomyces montanus]